jgi:lysophospholipase
MSELKSIQAFDNHQIPYQVWLPDNPVAISLYVHGAFAWSGEGEIIAKELLKHSIGTYAHDQRGWGSKASRSGFVKHRDHYLSDVISMVDLIQANHKDLPIIIIGHSMGGLVSLSTLIKNQDLFSCAVISSPWIETKAKPNLILDFLANFATYIWPTFSDKKTFELNQVVRDPEVIKQYEDQEKQGIRKDKATTRWYIEIKKLQKYVLTHGSEITLPIIFLQSGQDYLVREDSSRRIYELIQSENKIWEYLHDYYHEVFNDLDREYSLEKAITFILDVLK